VSNSETSINIHCTRSR